MRYNNHEINNIKAGREELALLAALCRRLGLPHSKDLRLQHIISFFLIPSKRGISGSRE